MRDRHYKLTPEPLSEEARKKLTGGRDEMIRDAMDRAARISDSTHQGHVLEEPERKLNSMKLADVAESLDLAILSGLCGDDAGNTWTVFYLGQPPELNAGLRGFSASPSFRTKEELEAWANEHWQELYTEFIAPFLEEPESKFEADIQDIIGLLRQAESFSHHPRDITVLALIEEARRKLVALAKEEGR